VVRLRARQAQLEAQLSAVESRAARAALPVVGIGPDGFFLGSRDSGFLLRLRGVVQADGHAYLSEALRGNDTVNLRLWKGLQLRAGKFKTPLSLERLQTEQYVVFIARRGRAVRPAPGRVLVMF
jgi:hypothetical protein